jgi:hypothetical protein
MTLMSGLLSCLATTPVVSESKKSGNGFDGHSYSAQWSADPEKGWVRTEERHNKQERSESTSKFKSNNGSKKAAAEKTSPAMAPVKELENNRSKIPITEKKAAPYRKE